MSIKSCVAFEKTVFAILDMLEDCAVYKGEGLASYALCNLLLLEVKQALRNARWWSDLMQFRRG